MSFYIDAVLYSGAYFTKKEKKKIEEKINEFFWDEELGDYEQRGFVSSTIVSNLWVGDLRNIDVEALVEHLMNIDWGEGELRYPLQLMVRGEDDDRFRIIDIF